jgi:hypothetical protein
VSTSKQKFRENIVFTGAICRLGIFIALLNLYNPGLRIDQFFEMKLILAPQCCLYLALVIVYVVRYGYKYQRVSPPANGLFVAFGYFFLIASHIAEFILIYYKHIIGNNESLTDTPFYNFVINDNTFFSYISGLESAIAIFSAVYLSALFSVYHKRETN